MPSAEIIQLVGTDVTEGLKAMFEPTDGFRVREAFEGGIGDDVVAAVPWEYDCSHTGDFQGVFPTGRPMRIEGLTIVDQRGDQPAFTRYIDWTAVFGQLGMTVSTRVAVGEDEYRFGLDRIKELRGDHDPDS
jgi:hypothetical protein